MNLRYSHVAPLTMFDEKNAGTNLPAQVDVSGTKGDEYNFLFIAKGGGLANKTFLYHQTKALNTGSLESFLEEKIKTIGTSACPSHHLAVVIGGIRTCNLGTGAQFGGKYFCHDVRVVRLLRHGTSCLVGTGVSCNADR